MAPLLGHRDSHSEADRVSLSQRPNQRVKLAGLSFIRNRTLVPWRGRTSVHSSCAAGLLARSLRAIR